MLTNRITRSRSSKYFYHPQATACTLKSSSEADWLSYLFKVMNCKPNFSLSIENTAKITPSHCKVWL